MERSNSLSSKSSPKSPQITNNILGKWSPFPTNGSTPPCPGHGCAIVMHHDTFYITGGAADSKMHTFFPETSAWQEIGSHPKRYLHSAILYNNLLVIFGGSSTRLKNSVNPPPPSEIFEGITCYDIVDNVWSKAFPTAMPRKRFGHTAVLYRGAMYVFGGCGVGNVCMDELFSLGLEDKPMQWTNLNALGGPGARYLHTCVIWDGNLWIFGGRAQSDLLFNDMYKYDIAAKKWSQVQMLGDIPDKRFGHSAVVHGDYMYLFGGMGVGQQAKNDFFQFSLKTQTWKRIPSQVAIVPRHSHAAIVFRNKMFILGGTISDNIQLNDMWTFDFEKTIEVEELGQSINEDILKMYDNPSLGTDVVFKVGKKTINAHKSVLSARCPYFDILFKSGLKESISSEVLIDNVDEEVFEALLKYLYGSSDSIVTPEVSLALMCLSESYFLPKLKRLCERVAVDEISEENVTELLVASDTYKCKNLYDACMTFIDLHFPAVKKNIGSLPPHLQEACTKGTH